MKGRIFVMDIDLKIKVAYQARSEDEARKQIQADMEALTGNLDDFLMSFSSTYSVQLDHSEEI